VSKWISKQQILNLAKGKNFGSEDEFRDHIAVKIEKLLEVKHSQISIEPDTTSFDRTLSNRADIVIRTDDNLKKAILVIELKLMRNVDKYKLGDYEDPVKQLKKYCQDTRAPFGILLTEVSCAIYKNKYFFYNQEPKRVEEDKLPSIESIEDTMALYALLDFLLYRKSTKYIIYLTLSFWILGLIFKSVTTNYGFWASMGYAFIIGSMVTVVLLIMAKVFKIFE
jgi:hypothetical protein